MPKSILEIPVDDSAFQAFLGLFNQYRDQVAELPGEWAETDKVVAAIGAGFAAMTAAQLAAAEAQRKQDEALKKQHDEAKRILDLERQRREEVHKVWQDSVKIAKNMASVTLEIFKWVGFGGLFALAADALGMFGLDKMANAVSDQRRAAQGYNLANSGQLVGLRTEFGRYANVDTALENIAQAQFDPSKQYAFNLMGIRDAQRKDPGEIFLEMLRTVGPLFRRLGENPMLAHAYGLDQFFDMDTLRRLARPGMPEEERTIEAEYRKRLPDFEQMDKTNKEWQEFSVNMEYAKQKIFLIFVRGLEPIVGPLGKFTDELADLVQQFVQSKGFKSLVLDVKDGLGNLVDAIKSGEFEAKFKEFIADFGQLTTWMHDQLINLGIIKEPAAQAEARRAKEGFVGKMLDPRYNAGDEAFGGSGYESDKDFGGPQMHFQKNANMKETIQYLRHFDPAAQAALLGDAGGESGLDPFAWGDPDKRTGQKTAFGLFQWHADRRALFEKYFGYDMTKGLMHYGGGRQGVNRSIDDQLKFAIMEMGGQIKEEHGQYTVPGLFKGESMEQLVADLVHRFERSANQGHDVKVRTQAAREITIIIKPPAGASTHTSAKAMAGQS
jgi:hypothetical protein